jgi:hypothetical protein
MYGHPAIAYWVAQSILDERREEARAYRQRHTRVRAQLSVADRPRYKQRSVRLGRYRLTLTKEVPSVPSTV